MKSDNSNPCLSCGACCALYRVTFLSSNRNPSQHENIPPQMLIKAPSGCTAMKGTYSAHPRCAALEGIIGISVKCLIYFKRPPPCRDFKISWEDGIENERCDNARDFWKLSPLTSSL